MDQVQVELERAVLEVRGISSDQLDLSATLQLLNIDSLDLVEIGMIVEEAFSTRIEADDFRDCITYGDVLTVFRKLVGSET